MAEEFVKERILNAGRESFFALGFSKVTMDELATQLGISKKTMYKYFPSKDDLADAVMNWHLREMAVKIKEIVNADVDYLDKLHNLWMYMAEIYSRVSKQCQDDIRKNRPELWKRIEEFRRESILSNFSKLVDEGVRRGILRSDINKDILVLMYLNATQGIINPDILMKHSFSATEAYKTILSIIFDGILHDSARSQYRTKVASDQPTVRVK